MLDFFVIFIGYTEGVHPLSIVYIDLFTDLLDEDRSQL